MKLTRFADLTKTLDVPDEPGATVTFRKLNPRQLGAASQARIARNMADIDELGGVDAYLGFMNAVSASAKPTDPATPKPPADPMAQFDEATLVARALTSWTYEDPIPTTTEAIEDVPFTAWLAREILMYAKPELFQTKAEQEVAQGNV